MSGFELKITKSQVPESITKHHQSSLSKNNVLVYPEPTFGLQNQAAGFRTKPHASLIRSAVSSVLDIREMHDLWSVIDQWIYNQSENHNWSINKQTAVRDLSEGHGGGIRSMTFHPTDPSSIAHFCCCRSGL